MSVIENELLKAQLEEEQKKNKTSQSNTELFQKTIKDLFNSLHERLTVYESRVDRIEDFLRGHSAKVMDEIDGLKRSCEDLRQ